MDRRVLLLVSSLFVQGLYAASIEVPSVEVPSTPVSANLDTLKGTPLESLSNLTPNDAKVLAELQRLRQSGERFQSDAMNFIQSLPTKLSDGFTQSHQLFRLLAQMFANAVNSQVSAAVQNLQAGGRFAGDAARGIALEGLKRSQSGINAGVNLGENVLETVRSNGNALLQGGVQYLQPASASLQTRSLTSEAPLEVPAETVKSPLEAAGDEKDTEDYEEDFDPENYSDTETLKDLPQHLTTRDDKPLTTVLSEQIGSVGTASSDAVKNVAQFTTGGLRGLLEALSAVIATTTDVGIHARNALSSVNKSSANVISSVIDTSGNLVSGALDKTGSVVGSIRIGGGNPASAVAGAVPTPPVKTRR